MAADNKLYTSRCLRELELRLLRLHPATSSSEKIVCDLIYIPTLHDSEYVVEYEALSYVWGSVEDKKSVEVSGTCIEVTQNLFNALKLLRLRDDPRDLWVDAVCINQQDKEERRCQVRQMGTIYNLAQQVVVVTERTLSPANFRAIHRLCSDKTLHWCKDVEPQQEAVFQEEWEYLRLLHWFLDHWWDRVWTTQEAILARKLVFVHESGDIDDSTLLELFDSYSSHIMEQCCSKFGQSLYLGDLRQSMGAIYRAISQVQNFRERDLGADILELLVSFRRRRCTLDHDKIYGMMGIANNPFPEDFIDYEEPFTRTFERITREVIQQSGTLDVFSHVFGPDQTARGYEVNGVVKMDAYHPYRSYVLPSWVPDWSLYVKKWMHFGYQYRMERLKHHHTSLELVCGSISCEGELSLMGLINDVVSEVGPICWVKAGGQESDWERWSDFLHDHPDFQTRGSRWLDLMTGGEFNMANRPTSEAQRLNAMFATTMNRRPFITRTGRVGLGPWSAEVGDKLCILYGGKTPYLIREDSDSVDKEDTRYIFLGDTYVPGLMQGEALNDPELVPRTIILGNSPPPTVEVECDDAATCMTKKKKKRSCGNLFGCWIHVCST